MPLRRLLALGPYRDEELDDGQWRRERQPPPVLCPHGKEHPPNLACGNSNGVAQRALASRRMRDGHAQPLTNRSKPKDHVAHDADCRIEIREEPRYAGGKDEDPDHLHQDGQAVPGVVGVVGRGKPRESHPRPQNRKEDDRVGDEGVTAVSIDQLVVQRRRCLGDRHDEGEIEEQLERGGGAVLLVGVASRHRCQKASSRHRAST
jgi:hypothetical protein